MSKKTHKAISLISGGLDSMLSTQLLLDQGVHVEGINFFTGFCVEGHTHAIRKKDKKKEKRNNALWVAEQLGIKLHIIDVIEEYKSVLLNPVHGYGQNMNPCLDCKGFMVRKAFEWIQENDFDFIITGEVMGQRPMSQRRDTMPVVARESGAGDLLLRPLCAKHLPETYPEQQGWVDREKLLSFHGRSRKPQMALAEEMGFKDYSQPAGGCCFLTDANYSAKLVDLWKARGNREYSLDDIILLKVGRHIRPKPSFKLIVAREEGESRFLNGYRYRYKSLTTISHAGPVVLIIGEFGAEDLVLAAQITARFSQGRDDSEVTVQLEESENKKQSVTVVPIKADKVLPEWYV